MIPKAIPLRDEAAFHLAMRHRSLRPQDPSDSYERLEFLGDSVLGLVVAQYLFEHHPDWDEGMMSKAKSSIVQEGPLSVVARRLGLEPYMELSPAEELAGGRNRPAILADMVEAVIGAIYLESGLEVARWFVLEQLADFILRVRGGDVAPDDHKSKLQEVGQSIWRKAPYYRVARESGTAHERRFLVQVVFDDEVMGEGEGRSKKEAEQAAAQDALALIERARRPLDRTPERFE